MAMSLPANSISLRILESAAELAALEDLQRLTWPGSETEIVPLHLLRAAVHAGGLSIGAFDGNRLVGFVFGFVGAYLTPDGPRLKHHSHMLAVHPDYRNQGLGFKLKRAQWQMVRRQGIDLITWTYDPLQSRNAHLNIARLGAVCNTYLRDFYGQMRDGLNEGLPSDRFQVDWWVYSRRVNRRLSRRSRKLLSLGDFTSAETPLIHPLQSSILLDAPSSPLLLVEIPDDIAALKAAAPAAALDWRMRTRLVFETLFAQGYLVTDFVHQPGDSPRSFYVLTHGEVTL